MTFPLAFVIGFSVASIPGPMIILIATETLRKGARSGLATMSVPIIMDAAIMLPLGLLLQASIFFGRGAVALGLVGAAFLAWLGMQSMRAGEIEKDESERRKEEFPSSLVLYPSSLNTELSSFKKGFLTHLTSPYPYLYWGTVGSTFVRQGFEAGGLRGAAIFPLGFWLGATVFTVLVIYLIAHGRKMLPERAQPYLHRVSGLLLIASGLFVALKVWQGLF